MAKMLPVIFTSRRGKEYIRSKPLQVRQTAATRAAASRFGLHSRLASAITRSFRPLIAVNSGMDIYHRFFQALQGWVRALDNNPVQSKHDAFFTGFRFVPLRGMDKVFAVPYTIDNGTAEKLRISIPAFVPARDIAAPTGCRQLVLKLMALSCQPHIGEVVALSSAEVEMAYDQLEHPPHQVELDTGTGQLVFLAMAIKYDNIHWGNPDRQADLYWMPGGIVASWYR